MQGRDKDKGITYRVGQPKLNISAPQRTRVALYKERFLLSFFLLLLFSPKLCTTGVSFFFFLSPLLLVRPNPILPSIMSALVPYDPSTIALTGPYRDRFMVPSREFHEDGVHWVTVRLTARGNEALRQLCHTEDQKTVWRFPAYEFTMRANSIRVQQVGLFNGSSVLLIFRRFAPAALRM